jgi:hypothetical protein
MTSRQESCEAMKGREGREHIMAGLLSDMREGTISDESRSTRRRISSLDGESQIQHCHISSLECVEVSGPCVLIHE